ncbi:S8 family serine peptidase, partial [Streptomyces sp. NPDC058953]|uniref:S8 family peptidase n=1 Tax=Streptomyces sp. NPDC058953 TaxID=3346676 RepID=UPI0036B71549
HRARYGRRVRRGVDQDHPDLAGRQIAERNFSGAPDAVDRVGHGTHVASIALGTGAASGGRNKGVAPGARFLDGKVLDDDNTGLDSSILAGLEWAVAQGADIVNLSLGGPNDPGTDPLEEAVDRLSEAHGTLFVAAAGNAGRGGPGHIASPGSARSALTVGAVDRDDVLAPFSSRGPLPGAGLVKPDVTAPGTDIEAARAGGGSGYIAHSGTSMAAPHVTGAAALLAQHRPDWRGERIKNMLTGSARTGAHTPFEQGTGRVDLAAALKGTVVAEGGPLDFGVQRYPHTDDTPVTRNVTYRNLGTEPVDLEVTAVATGPDGKPAPAGFVTGGGTLTVPAGGTATVGVTVDTRIGGDTNGGYAIEVTATGGGTTVRGTGAVEREIESYDLTIRHLGRNGAPTGDAESYLEGMSGPARGRSYAISGGDGSRTLRVPRGAYFLGGAVYSDPLDPAQGFDVLGAPHLDVIADTTVTLDARTTRPVSVSAPVAGAKARSARFGFTRLVGSGADEHWTMAEWELPSFQGLRSAHTGPAVPPAGLFHQGVNGAWTKGTDTYALSYNPSRSRLVTGFRRTPTVRDLAEVTVRLGSPATGRTAQFAVAPVGDGEIVSTFVSAFVPLPATRKVYTGGERVAWNHWNFQRRDLGNGESTEEGFYGTPQYRYRAGERYVHTLGAGVFGPKIAEDSGLYREGDRIKGAVRMFSDGDGNNPGLGEMGTISNTLYRDGVEIATTPAEPGLVPFTVPADRSSYRLVTTATRDADAYPVSDRITAEWTFDSARTPAAEPVPVSAVRFTPALALDSTAPAGRPVRVPVTVQGAAAGAGTASLAVSVSYDDGRTWRAVPVRDGAARVVSPAAGRGVALRADVADLHGNTLRQTVHNAFRGK